MIALPNRFRLRLACLASAMAVLSGCASSPRVPLEEQKAFTPVAAASAPVTRPTLVMIPESDANTASASENDPIAALIESQPIVSHQPQDNTTAIGEAVDPFTDRPADFSSNADKDLWDRMRRGFAMPDLQDEYVTKRERWYANQPDYIQRMSKRGGRYLYYIIDELERRKMPTELALLPFVESAMNPTATSTAKAQGLWQFMPATGRHFNLEQNLFRDERRDVLASTRAAMDYLQRLYDMFGDWHLALASYNWGEGSVMRAIKRNQALGLPTDYGSLKMPDETRNYVPKLQALKNIVKHPEQYGIELVEMPNHPYFLSVPIQRDIDVDLAARMAGMPLEEFKSLNPSQKKSVILASGTPQLLLPFENAEQFRENLERYKGPLASYTAWVVPKTMKTSEAAESVNMTESALRELNNIPPRMLIKAGSTLLVNRASHMSDVSEAVANNASLGLAPDIPPVKRMTIIAKRGDSIAAIAKRYRLNPRQVAQWNRLSAKSTFKRGGQALVLWVPENTKVIAPVALDLPAVDLHSSNKSKNHGTSRKDEEKTTVKMVKQVIKDKKGRTKVVMVAVKEKNTKSKTLSSAQETSPKNDQRQKSNRTKVADTAPKAKTSAKTAKGKDTAVAKTASKTSSTKDKKVVSTAKTSKSKDKKVAQDKNRRNG